MPNIINEIKLDFKDVLLRPKRSTLKSRADVDLFRNLTFRNSKRTYRGIPVIASNMDTVGTFEMAKVLGQHKMFTTVHKYYSVDEWKKFAQENPEILEHIAVSSGSSEEDFAQIKLILEAVPQITFICLDVANGYSQHFIDFVRKVRSAFPTHTIMAGNVVTGEMVEELILSGADIVKVGIGPGSVCTTRIKTGVGYPQLSCVMECADAAHGLQGHIVADGGCTCAGDVAKAFGAGADFVMIGGLFAGHDQSGGELTVKPDGTKVKLFYGMSSSTAMLKHVGNVANYRASEGKTVEVPYRGDVTETVQDILGGIRSACTYTGAAKLKELPRRATFIRCTQQANPIYSTITVKQTKRKLRRANAYSIGCGYVLRFYKDKLIDHFVCLYCYVNNKHDYISFNSNRSCQQDCLHENFTYDRIYNHLCSSIWLYWLMTEARGASWNRYPYLKTYLRQNNDPAKYCEGWICEYSGLTRPIIDQMLNVDNEMRDQFAVAHNISNLYMLEWYPVLEYWAQDKANLCLPPTTQEFYDYAVIQKYGVPNYDPVYKDACQVVITSEEIKAMDTNPEQMRERVIDHLRNNRLKHFRRLPNERWDITRKQASQVGCGYTLRLNKTHYIDHLVCLYGSFRFKPRGRYYKETKGPPCTNCNYYRTEYRWQCGKRYTHLCVGSLTNENQSAQVIKKRMRRYSW